MRSSWNSTTRGDSAPYVLSFGVFVLGLFSKTVTATLPAAMLVIFWWKRGRLSWRRDVWPLAPFFVFGAVAGFVTAWVERKLIGAEGVDFELTFLQRGLLAGLRRLVLSFQAVVAQRSGVYLPSLAD